MSDAMKALEQATIQAGVPISVLIAALEKMIKARWPSTAIALLVREQGENHE